MKKIFAFILATIMVMSLVPASVFAAISNDKGCPNVHTVKNCEYTEIGKVDATCTDPSYTLYTCEKCGKQFADNFGTKAAGHKWVDATDKNHPKTEADCSKEADGKVYQKCTSCGQAQYNTIKFSHKWVEVSGYGCTTVYKCSVCDKEKTDSHNWQFTEVLTEPEWTNGKYVPGTALFTCKECKDTKTVEILDVECKHNLMKGLTLVKAAVEDTCTEVGYYAVYKCDDCGQLFKLVSKDNYEEIAKVDNAKLDTIQGHTVKAGTEKTVGCTYSYTCATCKQTITEDKHPDAYVETTGAVEATCTTWGYKYLLCRACGKNWVDQTNPTGHKTVTLEVAATCASEGGVYTLCCNKNCSGYTKNGISKTENKVVYDHIVAEVTIPKNDNHKPYVLLNGKKVYDAKDLPDGGCEQAAIYVWQCDNNCGLYFVLDQRPATGHNMALKTEFRNCVAKDSLGAYKLRTVIKCTKCSTDVTLSDVDVINDTVMFSSLDEAKFCHGIKLKTTDAKGKVTYIDRGGHTFVKNDTLSFAGNCTIAAYDVYLCTGCGQNVYVTVGTTNHITGKHVEGKAATCTETGIIAHDICALCNKPFTTENGKQTTLTTTVINKHGSTLTIKDTNCSKVNYYECTKCHVTFADDKAATPYTVPTDAHAWKNINVGNEATCKIDGVVNVRYCTNCKKLEANRNYRNTRTNELVVIELLAETEIFEGKKKTVTLDGKTLTIEANGTVKSNDTNKKTLAYSKLDHTDPKTGDSTISRLSASTGNADHDKVTFNNMNCSFCDHEYLTDYIPGGGHVNAAGQTLTTKCSNANVKDRVCVVCEQTIAIKHNYTTPEVVPATCVDEGYTIKYCKDCGIRTVSDIKGIDKNNHADPIDVEVNYAQNGYKQGKRPCAACGYKGEATTMKDKGLEVLVSCTVNGTNSGKATKGSIITVTLDLASLNGVDVWGIKVPLVFDPEVVEYVGAEFNKSSKFNVIQMAVEQTFVDDSDPKKPVTRKSGAIEIIAQANNADVNVKGSQKLVTLTFKVISSTSATAPFIVGEITGKYSHNFTYDIIDENGNQVTAFKNDYNYVLVEVEAFGDVDGDGILTMSDALALYTLILFDEYDVAADCNSDGKVDAADLQILYNALTGAN